MLKEIVIREHNVHVLNFNYIFKHHIERDLIDDLHRYELLGDRKDTTIKRLFYHHNIFNLCNFLLRSSGKEKLIVFFDCNSIYDTEISKYISEEKVKKYLQMVFKKVKSVLPIRVFDSTFAFDYFVFKFLKKDGIGKETLYKIKKTIDTNDFNKFTFEKCKKFVKREGLLFLDKHYFNTLKSKQLLLV